MSKMVLALATNNQGKEKEYALFFKKFPVIIKGLSEFKKNIL